MDRRLFIAAAAAGALALTVRRGMMGVDLGPVLYAWSGGMTTNSCRITVRTKRPAQGIRLIVARDPDFTDVVSSEIRSTLMETGCHQTFDVAKLLPRTAYHYGFEVDGEFVKVGLIRTFPEPTADVRVAFASCARTGSNSQVFDTIVRQNPDLFIHMGDFHYENIAIEAPEARREAYAKVHASPSQSNLYRHVPVAYMWDDHDYLGNNSDGLVNSAEKKRARTDARLMYQQCVPHYPLAVGIGDVSIGQAFSLGRARFVMTDNRSEKIPGRTMLGNSQKQWFMDELRSAKKLHPLIVWVNTVPWIGKPDPGEDFWSGFEAERQELADFLKAEGLAGRVCILSGDAHMMAIDDGTNSDYATGGGMPIPLFQAASLDQRPSYKGGPYSHPYSLLAGQFGLMNITDDGDQMRVRWQGKTIADRTPRGIEHEFVVKG